VVTITDNGGGISTDVMPRIFDPYFTTKEKMQGTGIGLYMSKIIIEQNMGGSLTAENVEGGVAFRIEV
jgi:C4-dicarboxylate-specific signal transduction histidine kinase